MLDRFQAPSASKAVKALAVASKAAGTPGPGAWAFYLGGPGHNGGHGSTYTNALLDDLVKRGVELLPIYVGKQGGLSRARGEKDANDAMKLARSFGRRNTMIATDIERHTSDENPKAAVQYVNGWTETLHAAGMRAMVYGSFNLAADLAEHGSPQPDAVWVARFVANKPESGHNPHRIKGVPDKAFRNAGQRAWQYGGAIGKVACIVEGINVDVSVVDSEIFGGHPAPAPKKVVAKAAAAKKAAPGSPGGQRTHVVRPKDTLGQIAVDFHVPVETLFTANRKVIEAEAKARGLPDSGHGHFIFPGTTLVIP